MLSETKKMSIILANKAQCTLCDTVIESMHRHDWAWCKCGAIFTDGGRDYIRRGGALDAIKDLSEYLEVDFAVAREQLLAAGWVDADKEDHMVVAGVPSQYGQWIPDAYRNSGLKAKAIEAHYAGGKQSISHWGMF